MGNILLKMLLGSLVLIGTIIGFLLILESACKRDDDDRGGEDGT